MCECGHQIRVICECELVCCTSILVALKNSVSLRTVYAVNTDSIRIAFIIAFASVWVCVWCWSTVVGYNGSGQ